MHATVPSFPKHPCEEPALGFRLFFSLGGREILAIILGRETFVFPQKKPDLFPFAEESQIATSLALM